RPGARRRRGTGRTMTPWVRLGVFLLAAPLVAQPAPTLEVTSPVAGAYVSGRVMIEARLQPFAAERGITRVTFFADGVSVCDVTRRPYRCGWNAGAAVRAHVVRVVVEMQDGSRLVRTVHTRGVDLGESTGVSAVKVTATVTAGGRFMPGLKP